MPSTANRTSCQPLAVPPDSRLQVVIITPHAVWRGRGRPSEKAAPVPASTCEDETRLRHLKAAPSWTNDFQQGPGEPEVRDDIFDMGLELFRKAETTPDYMISTRPTPNPPFAGCGSGVFFNMGLQEQQADDFAPDIYWAF